MEKTIGTIGNSEGGLSIRQKDTKTEDGIIYQWGIENYNGTKWEEIPKVLYDKLISFEKSRLKRELIKK